MKREKKQRKLCEESLKEVLRIEKFSFLRE